MDITKRINTVYDLVQSGSIDHFELFGIKKTSTLREIEEGFKKQTMLYSDPQIGPELKDKVVVIRERLDYAFSILSDYNKRADYEKKGFRDELPEEEKTEVEEAREIYRKAKVLYNSHKFEPAVAVLEQAVKMDATKGEYFLLLGLSQAKFSHKKREAEQSLNKAFELDNWNPEPLVALGLLFLSENLKSRAESYFRRALDINADHAVAKKKLEEIAPEDKNPMMTSLKKGLKKTFPSFFKK